MVKPITEVSEDDWNACIDTNLKGPFFGCKYAIAQMQKNGGGAIVNVSSAAARLGSPSEYVDYAASKGAIDPRWQAHVSDGAPSTTTVTSA
mgnify:CR=1 FL=1